MLLEHTTKPHFGGPGFTSGKKENNLKYSEKGNDVKWTISDKPDDSPGLSSLEDMDILQSLNSLHLWDF